MKTSRSETSTERRNYFFFAVFLTVRLRAGALFFAFFAVFLFIAISGLLRLWSCAAAKARRHDLATTPIKLMNLY